MCKKFQSLYRNTGFLERDAIFIRLSTKTLDDFQGMAEFTTAIKKNATRLKEIGITDLRSWIYTTWLLHGLSFEYNVFKMMLNNNQRATESEGEKKELDFDSVLEQLLNMSKDSPTRNDPRLLKTFAPKSKNKSKSSSNETCSYCSKPGHNERNCYYKYPNKRGDAFRERNKVKIAELRHSAGHKNAMDRPGVAGLQNARGFDAQNTMVSTSSAQDDGWYFDKTASFDLTFDLADFDDQELVEFSKDETIRSAFCQEERPQGFGRVWYNFVVDGVSELYYLDDVRWCPHLDMKLISLGLLDQKGLTYSAHQGEFRVQLGDRTIITGVKNDNNLYSVNLDILPALQDVKNGACISKQSTQVDLLTWHRCFCPLNEASVRHLPDITKGTDISFYNTPKLPFCKPCIKSKMTRQPHRKPRVRTTRPGYRIHVDVGGGGDTYISWRGYKYFFLAVCEATNFSFDKFMKKKSEELLVFIDLVTFLDRQHDMKVYILHTDFGEFNSAAAESYFARKGIKWEASAPYFQQQNGLAERHMRITIEGA